MLLHGCFQIALEKCPLPALGGREIDGSARGFLVPFLGHPRSIRSRKIEQFRLASGDEREGRAGDQRQRNHQAEPASQGLGAFGLIPHHDKP